MRPGYREVSLFGNAAYGNPECEITLRAARYAARKTKPCPAGQGSQKSLTTVIYTLKDEPQPQVVFTLGFSNLKPAPSSVST